MYNKCTLSNWKVLFLNAGFKRCECSKYSSANTKLAKVFEILSLLLEIDDGVKDFVKYSTKF